MVSLVDNALNEQPAIEGLSSDEGFAAPTSVGDANEAQATDTLREQFNRVRDEAVAVAQADVDARTTAERRHTKFIANGFTNAHALMQPGNEQLLTELVNNLMGEPLGASESQRLGQIARLHVGRAVENKTTKRDEWKVEHRRDERLARFYRIFWNDPKSWPLASVEADMLKHKGKSGGILDANKPSGRTQVEIGRNETAATQLAPLGKVPVQGVTIKEGRWRLALVEVGRNEVLVRSVVNGQTKLAERLAEAWCAENAVHSLAQTVANGGNNEDAA